MFWVLFNLALFCLNMAASDFNLLTLNGAVGLFNLFVAGVLIGSRE